MFPSLVCLAGLTACVPTTAGFLRIPIRFDAPPTGGQLTVTADCQEIRALLPDFDPATAAFYGRGRHALPYRQDDHDGDGHTDSITITLDSEANQEAWLVIVCPGPRPESQFLEPIGSRRLHLDFRQFRR